MSSLEATESITSPWPINQLAPPWILAPLAPPGSLIPLAPPWSVVALPAHGLPGLEPCFVLPPFRLRLGPRSHQLFGSAWASNSISSVSVCRPPGSACQVSTMAPPSLASAMDLHTGCALGPNLALLSLVSSLSPPAIMAPPWFLPLSSPLWLLLRPGLTCLPILRPLPQPPPSLLC